MAEGLKTTYELTVKGVYGMELSELLGHLNKDQEYSAFRLVEEGDTYLHVDGRIITHQIGACIDRRYPRLIITPVKHRIWKFTEVLPQPDNHTGDAWYLTSLQEPYKVAVNMCATPRERRPDEVIVTLTESTE
jgi:hypothetical protein